MGTGEVLGRFKLPVTQGDFQSYFKPTEIVTANDDHGMPC